MLKGHGGKSNGTPVNLLDLVPERKRPFEVEDNGRIAVLVPRYGTGRVGRLLDKVVGRGPVRLELDEIGTHAWKLCDGEHSVHSIAESLREHYGESVEPVYDRLALFLKQLASRGLIELR